MKLLLQAPTGIELTELDAPNLHIQADAGGEGYGPLQMFVASLGPCTASVLITYSQNVLKMAVNSDLRILLRWHCAHHPYRIQRIDMDIVWPGLPEQRLLAAKRADASCTIHRTLLQVPVVSTSVRAG
jgi:uncharacterized OsmC-like protein